jgi:hypothetical protein
MTEKNTPLRRAGRWALGLVAVLLVLFAIQLALLAFPQLLVSNTARAGTVVIRYDGSTDPEMATLAEDVNRRLERSGLYDSTRSDRVFYLRNQGLYSFFARLSGVHPKAQGFELSLFGNAFVSETNVAALGARTGNRPRFSVWEGSPAHTIAHELAHLQVTGQIGTSRWQELPHWKQEGLPEYMANIAEIRRGPDSSLSERLRIHQDDRAWAATLGWSRHGWDRLHYEAELLIEFLIEVRGLTVDEIIADDVTKVETLVQLAAWATAQEAADRDDGRSPQ